MAKLCTAILVWICLISYNIVHSVYVLGGSATSSRLQWLYRLAMQTLILTNFPHFASYRVCRFVPPKTLNNLPWSRFSGVDPSAVSLPPYVPPQPSTDQGATANSLPNSHESQAQNQVRHECNDDEAKNSVEESLSSEESSPEQKLISK